MICQRMQAVRQVDAFHQYLGVRHRDIVIGKIPEARDAEPTQQVRQLLHIGGGNAHHRTGGVIVNAEIL